MNVIKSISQMAKKPYPLAGIERKIYSAIILLIISGVFLSISLNDWQYFELFGSLIVIVGIAVAWRDLTGKFDQIEDIVSKKLSSQISLIKSNKPGSLLSKARNQSIENEITNHQKELARVGRNNQRALRRIKYATAQHHPALLNHLYSQ